MEGIDNIQVNKIGGDTQAEMKWDEAEDNTLQWIVSSQKLLEEEPNYLPVSQ